MKWIRVTRLGRPPGRSRAPIKVGWARWSSTRKVVGCSVRLGNHCWLIDWRGGPAAVPSSHISAVADRYVRQMLSLGHKVTIEQARPGEVRISSTNGRTVRRRVPDE